MAGIVLSTGSSENNRLANTKERDFSIGLDNHGFRYYDPEVGRYISPDPFGYPDGLNNYIYCGNNPTNRIDPQGLGWFSDVWDSAVQKFDAGLQVAADFSAGMADKLTGGATQVIRKKLDVDQVNYESGSYKNGGTAGAGLELAMNATGAAGAVKGLVTTGVKTFVAEGGVAALKEVAGNCAGQYVKNEVKGAIQEAAVEVAAEGLERAGIMDKETTQAVVGVAQTGIGMATELQNGRMKTCFMAGTQVATPDGLRGIEQIQVGDRVWSSPEEQQDSSTEIVPSEWRLAHLRMRNPGWAEDEFVVSILRPASLFEAEGYQVGAKVPFGLKEVGISGEATVEDLEPCPPIKPSPGRVVLMTVLHLNEGVVKLRVDCQTEPVFTTVYHKFFSATQQRYVSAGLLAIGESIATQDGANAITLSREPQPGAHVVYNIEVESDHRYYVGTRRLLVHNEGCGGGEGEKQDKGAKAKEASGLRTADEAGMSQAAQTRIQNAANKTNQQITVVGSRAAGTAGPTSDWDYVLSGKSRQRQRAKNSLPRGTSGGGQDGMGRETGIDLWQDYNPNAPNYNPVDVSRPHVVFTPKKKE